MAADSEALLLGLQDTFIGHKLLLHNPWAGRRNGFAAAATILVMSRRLLRLGRLVQKTPGHLTGFFQLVPERQAGIIGVDAHVVFEAEEHHLDLAPVFGQVRIFAEEVLDHRLNLLEFPGFLTRCGAMAASPGGIPRAAVARRARAAFGSPLPAAGGTTTLLDFRHQAFQFRGLGSQPGQDRFIAAAFGDHLLSQGGQQLKELPGDRLFELGLGMAQDPARPAVAGSAPPPPGSGPGTPAGEPPGGRLRGGPQPGQSLRGGAATGPRSRGRQERQPAPGVRRPADFAGIAIFRR